MTDTPSAYERGQAKMAEIYAGEITPMPEGTMAFVDVMNRTLFAEVWERDVMSVRDRRLLLMGVIAARGSADTWKVHATAALRNGELTAEELRETLVLLAPYAGFPVVSPLIPVTEAAIYTVAKEQRAAAGDG